MAATVSQPELHVEQGDDGGVRVRLSGDWRLLAGEGTSPRLRRALDEAARAHPTAAWSLETAEGLDAAGAALLWRTWGRRRPATLGLAPRHEPLFEALARVPEEPELPRLPPPDAGLVLLGRQALLFVGHAADLVALAGQLVLDLLWVVRRPSRGPWRELSANLHRAGGAALPITALVGFLIGVVLSYLSAQQLRTYGANVLIVDLLGVSILRELGPLIAAILVAGRSGSAMTAQIGVMRLTQELDAMAAMGLSVSRRLVLPRVLALGLALPLLVVWTDALALGGGMLAASRELGITPELFLDRFPDVVSVKHLYLGVAKGSVFGLLIGLTACHFGLRIRPDTESLGRGTTASVVAAITIVIVADALFAVASSRVGLP